LQEPLLPQALVSAWEAALKPVKGGTGGAGTAPAPVSDHELKVRDVVGKAAAADTRSLRRVLTELVKHVVEGHLLPSRVSKVVVEFPAAFVEPGAVGSSLLADVLWMVGVEFEEGPAESGAGAGAGAAPAPEWKKSNRFARFRSLVGDLLSCKLVHETTLKERLELDMLEACGLIASSANFKKSIVRINTKNKFLQHKYNLMKEETEGYAKLVTELCRPLTADSVQDIVRNVRTLIGYFRLDPNRVLDLVLEAFELVSGVAWGVAAPCGLCMPAEWVVRVSFFET
jgi:THO complex subunit 2